MTSCFPGINLCLSSLECQDNYLWYYIFFLCFLSFSQRVHPHTWKLLVSNAFTVAGVNKSSVTLLNNNKLKGGEERRTSPLLSNALIQTKVKEEKAVKSAVSKQTHLSLSCCISLAVLAKCIVHP